MAITGKRCQGEGKAAHRQPVGLAVAWSGSRVTAKPFAHLPVLGVPGWWEANQSPDFYADTNVFRAPKAAIRRLPI